MDKRQTHGEVPLEVEELARELSRPQPMRRGSLGERRVKCGKEGCACNQDPEARHGPYHSLTRQVEGKTRSRYLSPRQAEAAALQIGAAREFRERLEAYWEVCENWADQELEALEGSSAKEVAEKGGSKKPSGRR